MKVYRSVEMAHKVGLSEYKFEKMQQCRLLPQPTITVGSRRFYSEDDVEDVRAAVVKNRLLSSEEAAAELSLTMTLFRQMRNFGIVPQPQYGSQYCRADIEVVKDKVAEYLEQKTDLRNPLIMHTVTLHQRRLDNGLYSINDVAKACGVAQISIRHHIKTGRFEAPSHKFPGCRDRFYNQKEHDAWVEFYKDRIKRGIRGKGPTPKIKRSIKEEK